MSALRQNGVNPSASVAYYRNANMSLEEEEENKRQYEDSLIRKIIKTVPAVKLNLANSASKVALTSKEVADMIKNNQTLANVATEAATALTAVTSITGSSAAAKKQIESNSYLKNAATNIYGGITPSGASTNMGLLHNTTGNLRTVAGTATAGLALHDLLSGAYLANGGMSTSTKIAMGIANPALGAINLMGGMGSNGVGGALNTKLSSLTGVNIASSGLGAGLDFATGMGSFLLLNKFMGSVGNKIKELDPNNAKNVKKNQFATGFTVPRYNFGNEAEAGDYTRVLSFVKTMGPNGLNALSLAETMSISLMAGIKYNTSFMPIMTEMLDNLQNYSSPNKNRGNSILNSSMEKFGPQDYSGREFDNLIRNGKPDTLTRSLLGLAGFMNQASSLSTGNLLRTMFNTKDINSSSWDIREARLIGDKLAADKNTARSFGISLSDMNLIQFDLESWIATQDDKNLALLLYQSRIQRLIAEKTVEMAKNSNTQHQETMGAMRERLNNEQYQNQLNSDNYNFMIDGILRSGDDLLRKIPILKVLSPVAHMLSQGFKGLNKLDNLVNDPGSIKNYFGNIFKDAREKFISRYMDPSLKNEKDLRTAAGLNEISMEERFYSYMVNVFPGEFHKLLKAVGVKNAANVVSDKYSTDWISSSDLISRNDARLNKLKELLSNEMPAEDSFGGWLKDKAGRKFFGIKDLQREISVSARRNFDYINKLNKTLNIDTDFHSHKINQDAFDDYLSESRVRPDNKYLSSMDENLKELLECCLSVKSLLSFGLNNIFKNNPISQPQNNQPKNDPNDILKFNKNNYGTSVTELIEQRAREEMRLEQYRLSKHNLPFLEKIYDLLDLKLKFNSGPIRQEDPAANNKPIGFFDGLIDWAGDAVGDWLGFGDDNKKRKKDSKIGKVKGWFGKAFDSLKDFGKVVVNSGKGRIAALLTRIATLGPLLTNPLGMIIGGLTIAGGLAYAFNDDIKEILDDSVNWISETGKKSLDWLMDKIDSIYSKFKSFKEFIGFGDKPNQDEKRNIELQRRTSIIDNIMNDDKASISSKIDSLSFYTNQKSTSGYDTEIAKYANLRKKELAEQLNNESYKKYGIDINSSDMLNYKDQVRNLTKEKMIELFRDYNNLNKAEANVGPVEEKMRKALTEEFASYIRDASLEEQAVNQLNSKDKEEYKKLNPKFDSLLEVLKELKISIDPSKSNAELLSGIAQLNVLTTQGINSVALGIQEVATTATLASAKLAEATMGSIEYNLNTKITDLIPGLTNLGDKTKIIKLSNGINI